MSLLTFELGGGSGTSESHSELKSSLDASPYSACGHGTSNSDFWYCSQPWAAGVRDDVALAVIVVVTVVAVSCSAAAADPAADGLDDRLDVRLFRPLPAGLGVLCQIQPWYSHCPHAANRSVRFRNTILSLTELTAHYVHRPFYRSINTELLYYTLVSRRAVELIELQITSRVVRTVEFILFDNNFETCGRKI